MVYGTITRELILPEGGLGKIEEYIANNGEFMVVDKSKKSRENIYYYMRNGTAVSYSIGRKANSLNIRIYALEPKVAERTLEAITNADKPLKELFEL